MVTCAKYKDPKVSRLKFILLRIGDGIERGDIIEERWKLKRRYCGYYTDPCMRSKEHRKIWRQII